MIFICQWLAPEKSFWIKPGANIRQPIAQLPQKWFGAAGGGVTVSLF